MNIIVQKFGGSSVNTAELRQHVVNRVQKARHDGSSVVVVVSAMGRAGSPYATDTLLAMVDSPDFQVAPREQDLLLSCGEIISGVVLTTDLTRAGIPATFVTGPQAGIITDDNYGEARIKRVQPEYILSLLKEGKVVVAAGFQGLSESGQITTLGRGGSDTTAAALGVALNAAAIEIYTDVDGIKTADPRQVPEARTLEEVTYSEMNQLALEGAKVLHPRAVEIAMQKNIPLWVKSTIDEGFAGTLVTSTPGTLGGETAIEADRTITGLAHIDHLVQLNIELEDNHQQTLAFQELAEAGISVDFINVFPDRIILTISHDKSEKARLVLQKLGLHYTERPNCAKVAAVGAGMRGIPGVMAKIVATMDQENIKILQSSDSYTSIWCLIDQADLGKALNALHRAFCLN